MISISIELYGLTKGTEYPIEKSISHSATGTRVLEYPGINKVLITFIDSTLSMPTIDIYRNVLVSIGTVLEYNWRTRVTGPNRII